MSNDNKYKNLSEVDHCIRQYFSRYMAPTLIKEARSLQQKQTQEYLDRLEKNASPFVPVGVQLQNADIQLKVGGKWYKKSSDDVIRLSKEKWGKDAKFAHDYQTFLTSFYKELVRANGGKDSQQLARFAENYVANRFQGLIIEQLAKEKVPKSSASYIAKKAFDDSLLGLFPKIGPKEGESDVFINKKSEDIYNPNLFEKGAAIGGAMAIDAAMTGGYGSGSSLIVKGATKAGVNVTTKAANFLNSAWSGVALDGGLRTGFAIHQERNWQNEKYAKEDAKQALGDEDAIKKIQMGGDAIKKNNSEVTYKLNGQLERKLKISAPSFSSKTKKEMDRFYVGINNQAGKLLSELKANFSRQAIPFNANSSPPKWMVDMGKKRCLQCASGFYAIAMEMSRERKDWINIGGKRMTLKQVSQRAFDYAKAANACDAKPQAAPNRASKDAWDKEMDKLNEKIRGSIPESPYQGQQQTMPPEYGNSALAPDPQSQPEEISSGFQVPQTLTAGWEEALKSAGLSGFGDVTKNMGYVLAMLPDMVIGMFTGRNPNLQLEDNMLPLAAIFGGMFIQNPLLKLLLLGFGGANLLNSAGHAALGLEKPAVAQKSCYKQYEEEVLDNRISNPAIKGASMIAHIDGKPCVIGISETAIDAYENGFLPLSTLANAVLRKYDESIHLASAEYEKNLGGKQEQLPSLGIK